eukprot:Gb_31777 [translate_table: standard]
MPGDSDARVFIGNLDEKVEERVLYEIMIQAGPVVELYIPRDKDSKRHKGYGFAEYLTESDAHYAIKLFSGLVCLHNRPLRFGISGQGTSLLQSSPKSVQVNQMSYSPQIAHAQMTYSRSLPPSPSGSSCSSACNTPGAKRVGHHMKTGLHPKSQLSNNSIVAEAQRWNSHLTTMGQMGLESSSSAGSVYSYPSPSW